MPRGVAIPEVRDRLFAAAQRLLIRDGPTALSSRAITAEAGCAKGVLYNHFGDLDGFLAEFVLAEFGTALRDASALLGKAGHATVTANLTATAHGLLDSPVLAAHTLLAMRPSLTARLHDPQRRGSPNLGELERIFAAYLEAEQQLGRVDTAADTTAAAIALVATLHRVLNTRAGPAAVLEARAVSGRVIDVLLTGIGAGGIAAAGNGLAAGPH
jgi:AcrR family transcriptional regulator